MNESFTECSIAAKTWKIQALLADLDRVRQCLNPDSRGLEIWEQRYLCLLLSRQKPQQIATTLGYTVESIRVRLSKPRSLYECIQKLTHHDIENWRDVIIGLMDTYYLGYSEKRSRIVILTVATNDLTDEDVDRLEQRLSEITGNDRIKIIGIEEGSMIFVIQADEDSSGQIAQLWRSSQLSAALELPVTAVEVLSSAPPDAVAPPLPVASRFAADLTRFNDWLQGVFSPDWLPASDLIALPALRSIKDSAAISSAIVMAREIDLDRDQPIALLVQLTPTEVGNVHIRVRLYPTKQSSDLHLPHGVELLIIDEMSMTCMQARAGNSDVWINLEFSGNAEESFAIKVVMGEAYVIENFII